MGPYHRAQKMTVLTGALICPPHPDAMECIVGARLAFGSPRPNHLVLSKSLDPGSEFVTGLGLGEGRTSADLSDLDIVYLVLTETQMLVLLQMFRVEPLLRITLVCVQCKDNNIARS